VKIDEVGQIGRLVVVNSFVGYGSNFEVNALFNRKPMKFDKSRSDVIRTF